MQKQEEQFYLKQNLKDKKEKEVELQKELNFKLRNDIKHHIDYNKERKLQQIQDEAVIIKEQKKVFIFPYHKNNEETLRYIKMEEQSNNKSKYEYVKAQQMFTDEKKKAFEVYILL